MQKIPFFIIFLFSLPGLETSGQNNLQDRIDYYISQAQLDSAKSFILKSLRKGINNADRSALNYQLVKVHFMQSAYDEALDHAFSSLDQIRDDKDRVPLHFMIGVIYSAVKDFDKSISYFDQVVRSSDTPSLTVKAHLLLADLYLGKNDSINSGKSLTEAYKLTSSSDLDSKITQHVAKQYSFFLGKYEQCKELNFQIVRDSTSFLNSKSYAYAMIGDCLVEQDSLKKAADYYSQFLKLTVETKDPEQIKVAAQKLIKVYELIGDQAKANVYHKIYNEAVNDSLSFSVEKYRDLYNIERGRELKVAKTKTFWQNMAFGAILLFFMATGIYFYLRSKKVKKAPGKKINISQSETRKISAALETFIDEQLFLKPNITRKSFCSESNIKSERYLSQFINEKYKKSFSVFMNDLRVEYAYNRILRDAKFRNYKVEVIAKECGFGSKKSFERAFVAKYGKTPFKVISQLIN